jgi:UDP-glucose:(heptosyl)LPS alpha-1,3-glucosyltransferase
MKIALVVERFEPAAGGVEQVAWQMARGLTAAGHAVDVLARRGTPMPGVRFVTLAVPSAWQPLRVLAFSRAAAAAAKRGDYDVVHSLTRTRHQDVYRAGGGSHADYLERTHRGAALALRRLSPRHALLLGIERAVFADATQTVQCNSGMVRQQIAARYGVPDARLVVIHNGVDLQRFTPTKHPERCAPVWLFVGSGFHRKGLDVALRALAQARSAQKATLVVAGRDEPAAWRALATRLGVADRVRFAGVRPDVESLYAEADALILPTRYDAFANVCLEAMAAGLAVVTSGANGAAELLAGCGIVVDDAEDASGFARALDLLSDPVERSRRGEATRAVAETFSWDSHVARLASLYAKVARR